LDRVFQLTSGGSGNVDRLWAKTVIGRGLEGGIVSEALRRVYTDVAVSVDGEMRIEILRVTVPQKNESEVVILQLGRHAEHKVGGRVVADLDVVADGDVLLRDTDQSVGALGNLKPELSLLVGLLRDGEGSTIGGDDNRGVGDRSSASCGQNDSGKNMKRGLSCAGRGTGAAGDNVCL